MPALSRRSTLVAVLLIIVCLGAAAYIAIVGLGSGTSTAKGSSTAGAGASSGVQTYTLPMPSASMTGLAVAMAPLSNFIVGYSANTVYTVDFSGHVRGPAQVGSPKGIGTFALDDAHGRAYLVFDTQVGDPPSIGAVNLSTMAVTTSAATMPRVDLGNATTDPNTGDVVVTTEYTQTSPTPKGATLTIVDPTGKVVKEQGVTEPGNMYVDATADIVVVTGPQAKSITAYDTRTLALRWSASVLLAPAAVAIDSARHRLWLLGPDGNATVCDTRSGQVLANVTFAYKKPSPWASNNDLAIDPSTGDAYTSWETGASASKVTYGIDRLDPTTGHRTMLTATGGMLAGVTAKSDEIVGQDSQGNLWEWSAASGRQLTELSTHPIWSPTDTAPVPSHFSMIESGSRVAVVNDTDLAYNDTITSSTIGPGLVMVVFTDK